LPRRPEPDWSRNQAPRGPHRFKPRSDAPRLPIRAQIRRPDLSANAPHNGESTIVLQRPGVSRTRGLPRSASAPKPTGGHPWAFFCRVHECRANAAHPRLP
jgi:hypothetical protein